MLLTTKAIENAKKEDEQYFLKDGGGLRVAVNPTGSKIFQHRIRWKLKGKWKIFRSHHILFLQKPS